MHGFPPNFPGVANILRRNDQDLEYQSKKVLLSEAM